MAASLTALSASVTRILSLSGFPKELKTKDIQAAFSEWENVGGGFKIKWLDDTSLLLVFADPGVAKRAYLQTLAHPPASLAPPNSDSPVTIKPYDGPDAQSIIQNVNARHNSQRGHGARASSASVSLPKHRANNSGNNDREPSPTLPSLPTHPTLSALLGEHMAAADPAILEAGAHADALGGAPRIGDPAKRMLGAAMGVRHPGLGPRVLNGNGTAGDSTLKDVQRAMAGLVVAE
ncbi:hypothetical protein GLOTRDRAFT_108807 [Gloeophyllum trabeum ATCC 11539]|uniref:Uncharacterized protein n=1 Tax=Gloeophyllum trabeum (strain ATCC 11539 / FP-39264 / Madison 617) TaxID=670483 RepID=S7QK50_GLOTA|nr:uncharacterized protein GLOTRDRAFT_108807 [Gloeophyllum trabeum ATCC 11539]EPQ60116.1 hypothetical protein GLOTRDRAFT_108807 [Gloeophyllum trabeum ATCC 11539]